MCGGTAATVNASSSVLGLSPRVRGNPKITGLSDIDTGSIPACAGEPISTGSAVGRSRVYPRVCGGTLAGTLIPLNA